MIAVIVLLVALTVWACCALKKCWSEIPTERDERP